MCLQTLYTSATGMIGMETKLNTVAHNLANMETTAFKKQRCNFEDLFYDHLKYPGLEYEGDFTATGISVGVGTRVSSIQTQFQQGAHNQTNRPLDVAIQGEGFFRVTDQFTGETLYTRAGNFSRAQDGRIVLGSGHTGRSIEPEINIPEDATYVQIHESGEVFVQQPPETTLTNVGRIGLAIFPNPEGLLRLGENLFAETDASGPPTEGEPGDVGFGVLKQNALEMSNVEPVNELIDMITSQRAFELNSKVTQTGDEILQTVISIKR
jgi:flagellar basal-body rod protein FlgG, Gram-negative bacteria